MTTDSKVCTGCKERKPLTDFWPTKHHNSKDGRLWRCATCMLAYHRKKYNDLSPDGKFRRRARQSYHMTEAEIDAMLARSAGHCEVCSVPLDEKSRPCIDHDHACCPGNRACGKCIRGLICFRCNVTLQYLEGPSVAAFSAYLRAADRRMNLV